MVQTRPSSPNLVWTVTSVLLCVNAVMASALPSVPMHPLTDIRHIVSLVDQHQASTSARPSTDPGKVLECPRGHFFSEVARACQLCSDCPINQIIRKPCTPLVDTICGAFLEFDKFRQSLSSSATGEKNGETEELDETNSEVQGSSRTDHKPAIGQFSRDDANQQAMTLSLMKVSDQWRDLSFALIGVLSFICCIVAVIGLYVCIVLRRSQGQKVVIRHPAFMAPNLYHDPEPRYVETFLTSRNRIRTSGLSPIYEQILAGDYDTTEFLTSTSSCDVTKTEQLFRQAEGEDGLCVYVNTALLDVTDSSN